MTIMFHVDGLLMVRKCSNAAIECVKLLDGVNESQDPSSVTLGKTHEHLGMTKYFSLDTGVAFCQCDFIKKSHDSFHLN